MVTGPVTVAISLFSLFRLMGIRPLASTCTHTYIYPVYNPDTLMPRCFLRPQCHCWRTWNTPTSWPCTTSSTQNAASHWSLSILWVLWQNAQQRISNTPWPLNTVACLDRTVTSNSTWTTAEIWWACTTWRWATSSTSERWRAVTLSGERSDCFSCESPAAGH